MAIRPDFLGLEAFVAVAERGSFNRAAAHLGITQTALSHRMRKLEAYLGAALLLRTTRSVSLTPAGLTMLPRAKAILEDAQAAFAEFGGEVGSSQPCLAIGCLPTLAVRFLPDILKEFFSRHPESRVHIYDNSADEIANRVQKGDAEFGLTLLATGRWDLDIKPLVREPYVLVCHAKHHLAGQKSVTWAQLSGERLIRISTQTGNRIIVDDALGAVGEKLCWGSEVQHVTTAVALVSSGVGMTVVPRGTIDAVQHGDLACVPLRNPGIARTLGVVTRHGIPLSPPATELLAMIEAGLASSGHLKRIRGRN